MDNDNKQNKPTLSGAQEHIFTTDTRRWETLKHYARVNRKAQTAAENVLWQELRGA